MPILERNHTLKPRVCRRLNQDNMVIITVKAILEDAVHVTLRNVKTALLDGPGLAPVRLAVEDRVSADKVFFVQNDGHRDACFEVSLDVSGV